MSRRKLADAAEARRCLDQVAASGLTRVAWARAHGVDARSLNAWRLNLEQRRVPRSPMRLVEWVPTTPAEPEPARYLVRCGALEVEVDHRFDEGVLRRLLAVVTSC
jgi:transposase-like protein